MTKIGLIGGLSCASTIEYYKIITKYSNKVLGDHAVSKILINSINPDEITYAAHNNDWNKVTNILAQAANELIDGGADFIIIGCNSLHIVANKIQKLISKPLLNIIDVVMESILQNNYKSTLLLGTKFTMSNDFYKTKLRQEGNIEVNTPNETQQDKIHEIIFTELTKGIISQKSKEYLVDIINSSEADSAILGCTELPLLIQNKDTSKQLINSTYLHSISAANLSMGVKNYAYAN